MKNSKHTKGPWSVDFSTGHASINSNDKTIGHIHVPSFEIKPEDKANAHLIAAAPEMLEALNQMVKAWETQDWFQKGSRKILDNAVDVLKKARGES
jgi:TPP-dependent trihydroxycyclohexane-1,2-dione (THcHDO) dehydratase